MCIARRSFRSSVCETSLLNATLLTWREKKGEKESWFMQVQVSREYRVENSSVLGLGAYQFR